MFCYFHTINKLKIGILFTCFTKNFQLIFSRLKEVLNLKIKNLNQIKKKRINYKMKKKVKNDTKKSKQKRLYRKDDTKTEFKTRKIRLNESSQLRNNATKMLLNKNLKVNTKLKLNAFEKMNLNLECINVENITGETINGLAKYLLDDDNRIRSEFFKTVKNCFDRLNEKNQSLIPYIEILLIYIKCGLTHIDQRIVRDSKKLLDYLIQFMNDKCLNNHLIQVVNSRIKNNTNHMTLIDLELILLVLKIVFKNRNLDKNEPDINHLEWSSNNCTFVNEQIDCEEFEFNFSFAAISKEKEDIKEQFVNQIKEIVQQEVVNK